MSVVSRSQVELQFGANAGAYVTSEVHAKGESLTRLVDLVAPQRHWQVLDVATGAGHTALAFAPRVSRVTASDMTREMLDETARLAASRGLANVETVRASADALPFADASFDLVTCRLAAHHFAEPARFFAEVARVLRPGGRLGFVDNIAPDTTFPFGMSPDELAATDEAYDTFERLRDPSHARTLRLDEVRELVGAAGLEVQTVERLGKAMAFEPWAARQGCDVATTATLRAQLTAPGPLATFLMPHQNGTELWFTLQEAVLLAERPA